MCYSWFTCNQDYNLQGVQKILFIISYFTIGQSQRPRGLVHEMTSPSQTVGSWVRVTLVAWMSVRVSSVFVLSCVGSGLATGWSPVRGVLPTVCSSRLILMGNRPEGILRNVDYYYYYFSILFALVNDLICVGSLEGATTCARRLLTCYVVTLV
jgi:hypothetical protein